MDSAAAWGIPFLTLPRWLFYSRGSKLQPVQRQPGPYHCDMWMAWHFTQVGEDWRSHNCADWARYTLFRITASSWEDLPAARHNYWSHGRWRGTVRRESYVLSLIGRLSHASKVVVAGRIFLRRVIETAKTACWLGTPQRWVPFRLWMVVDLLEALEWL